MRFVNDRVSLLAAAAICGAWTSADAQQAAGSFERVLDVETPVVLEVVAGSGSIDVRSGGSDEVGVVGHISVGTAFGFTREVDAEEIVARLESEPPIEVSGNRVSIGRVDDPDLRNVSISYEITVPAAASAVTRSGSGDQLVRGIDGPVEVTAGSGDIRIGGVGGAARARTGSGSIEADGVGGPFTAQAGSGSVRLVQSGAGDVEVRTGSGDIELRDVRGGLRVRAGSGDVAVSGELRGPWEVGTGSGSVRIAVPEGSSFDVDVRTGSGRIDFAYPVTLEGSLSRSRVTGRVGEGGPAVRIRTGSGGVRIEQR